MTKQQKILQASKPQVLEIIPLEAEVGKPLSIVTNEDCMEMMSRYENKFFELAVIDPPYGINRAEWDKAPDENYFNELFRVSKNQIIWGGNYFNLPIKEGWLCWDKTINGKTFFIHAAKFELIWTSLDIKPEFIRYASNGNVSGFKPKPNYNYKEDKVDHPAHKPTPIYDWLLSRYAKPTDKILDTHLGSGSSRIAAWKAKLDFYGCELDKDYYEAQEERFKKFVSQLTLW